MGRGPARHTKISEAGPRSGTASQFFQRMGCGPARPIEFQIISAQPGPAHVIRSEAHETRAPYGPARGFEEPAHGPAHGLAHVLPRSKKCTLTFLYQVFRMDYYRLLVLPGTWYSIIHNFTPIRSRFILKNIFSTR